MIVVLAVVLAYYALTPPAPYRITIYTGGTGGVYYPLGVRLADLLNKYAGDKITASASSSGASVANARAELFFVMGLNFSLYTILRNVGLDVKPLLYAPDI